MKLNLLSILAFFTFSMGFSFAQDGIVIQFEGEGPDISGGTHSVDVYPSSPELVGGVIDVHFIVTNLTGSNHQWKITRKKINVPSSWDVQDQLCWPPQCFVTSGDVYTTPNTGGNPAPIIEKGTVISLTGTNGTAEFVINGSTYPISFNADLATTASDFVATEASNILATHGITLTNVGNKLIFDSGTNLETIEINNLTGISTTPDSPLDGAFYNELKPRITPDQNAAGFAHYRYYIVEATSGDRVDSVDLTINFVLGINTVEQSPVLSISPNPAEEYVNISVGSVENASVKIVDVLGNVVYNETISNGTKNIDISNFKNGVYFVLVETQGVNSINRKLIIRH